MDNMDIFAKEDRVLKEEPKLQRGFDSVIHAKEVEAEKEKANIKTGFTDRKEQEKRRTIGSYDQEMFVSSDKYKKNSAENVVKNKLSYDEFLAEHKDELANQETITRNLKDKETPKQMKVFNDFDNRRIQSRVDVNPQEVSKDILKGIEVIEKEFTTNYGKNKSPNRLTVINIDNLAIKNRELTGYVDGYDCRLKLIGFNRDFEMIFEVISTQLLWTQGTSRFFKDAGNRIFMVIEVISFKKNQPIEIIINGTSFIYYFKEYNKKYKEIENETVYYAETLKIIKE